MLVKIKLKELDQMLEDAQAMSDFYFTKYSETNNISDLGKYKEYIGQEIAIGLILEKVKNERIKR